MEMDHQLAVAEAILRLGIKGRKVILRLALAGHHADVVPADQRIQSGDPRQRRFWRYQPELSIVTQGILHIRFDTGLHLNFIEIFAQADVLHGTHLNALVAHRRTPGHDAVSRDEIDGDGVTAILIAAPQEPASNH